METTSPCLSEGDQLRKEERKSSLLLERDLAAVHAVLVGYSKALEGSVDQAVIDGIDAAAWHLGWAVVEVVRKRQ